MKSRPTVSLTSVLFCCLISAISLHAQGSGTALVRHGPTINGPVDGSVRQMLGENSKVNSGGSLTGDLLVPGTPTVVLNNPASYGGTIDGTGSTSPLVYTVTLNSGVSVRHVIRRTDAATTPTIAPPLSPTGTIDVTVNSSGQTINWSTVRNLTLNSNVGQVVVPPGTYGKLTANSGSGFTLGLAGSVPPAVYSVQQLTLNSSSQLLVAGPVMINDAGNVALAGPAGSSANLGWLQLNISSGDLTLNNQGAFYGYVITPDGTVTVNSTSQFVGGSTSDKLTNGSRGSMRFIDQPPMITITAPANGVTYSAPASFTITATASDPDGTIAKVEYCQGAGKLGETTTAPYQFTVSGLAAGSYTLNARATDDAGSVTTSSPVTVLVDAPPAVALTAPANGAAFVAPASISLAASASDSDGSVTKVEFFAGSTKIGESATAPYQLAWNNVSVGSYTLTAKATDNASFPTVSASVTIQVNPPVVPNVSFNPPPGGAVLASPATITLSTNATDPNGGTIAKVDFYLGLTLIGTATAPSAGSPSNFTFTPFSTFAPGVYAFIARATSSYGLSTTTPPLTITVLASLPYTTDFEPEENYALGSLSGQLGWSVTQGTAAVINSDAFHDIQSAILNAGTPPAQLVQTFAPTTNETIVFFDFFAKPVAESTADGSSIFDVEGARFAFVLNGPNAILDAGSGGGQWISTRFTALVDASHRLQTWMRLTVRLDFTHKTWDLYAGGQMVAADINFRGDTRTYLSSFVVQGDAATPTLIDDIYTGLPNPLFADVNGDGIDDAWETQFGLSLTTNNRDLSPAGNGVTVLQAYINGTDPNDYYQGAPPVITTISGSNGGEPGPQGLISVRVTTGDGTILANAPVTITGVGGIAAMPGGSSTNLITLRTDSQGIAVVYGNADLSLRLRFIADGEAGITQTA
jgi:hypothetical protein